MTLRLEASALCGAWSTISLCRRQGLGSTWGGFTIPSFSDSGFVPEGLGFRVYADDSLPQERISTLDVGIGRPSREDRGPRRGECESHSHKNTWSPCADYIEGDRAFLAACDMVGCVLYGYWRLLEKKIQAEGLEQLVDEHEEAFSLPCVSKNYRRQCRKQEYHKYISLDNLGREVEIMPEEEFVYDRKEELFFDVTSPGFQHFYRDTIRNLRQANCVRVVFHFGPRPITFPSAARISLGCDRVLEMVSNFASDTKVDIVLRGELLSYKIVARQFPWGHPLDSCIPQTYLDDLIREVVDDKVSTKELHPLTKVIARSVKRYVAGVCPRALGPDWVPYKKQLVHDELERIMRESWNVIHPSYTPGVHRVGLRVERVGIVDGKTYYEICYD
ncbi:hypothetical protein J3E71DRAFT_360475 [Bipolaris maydis]|nr:hypothetical protein J3E71DRAFT_360475 [Bipolaris maydis]